MAGSVMGCITRSSMKSRSVHTVAGVGMGGAASGGVGVGVLVLMGLLPLVHLASLAAMDSLSRFPFLKVGLLPLSLGIAASSVTLQRAQPHCFSSCTSAKDEADLSAAFFSRR